MIQRELCSSLGLSDLQCLCLEGNKLSLQDFHARVAFLLSQGPHPRSDPCTPWQDGAWEWRRSAPLVRTLTLPPDSKDLGGRSLTIISRSLKMIFTLSCITEEANRELGNGFYRIIEGLTPYLYVLLQHRNSYHRAQYRLKLQLRGLSTPMLCHSILPKTGTKRKTKGEKKKETIDSKEAIKAIARMENAWDYQ